MSISEPVMYFAQDRERPETFSFFLGTVGLFSCKKPESERDNQDSCGMVQLSEHKSVFIVADGMGGHRGGDLASKLAVEKLVETVRDFDEKKDSLREKILEGIEAANKAIRDLGIGAGTTIVVAEVNSNHVRFYSTGDSAGMLFGGKGTLKYRVQEQSVVGYAQASTIIKEKDLLNHPNRNVLLFALGDENLKIEISSAISTNSRDIVLLASDGLTDNVDLATITEIITSGTIEERMTKLIESARKAMDGSKNFGHPDDLTILLYSFGRNDPIDEQPTEEA